IPPRPRPRTPSPPSQRRLPSLAPSSCQTGPPPWEPQSGSAGRVRVEATILRPNAPSEEDGDSDGQIRARADGRVTVFDAEGRVRWDDSAVSRWFSCWLPPGLSRAFGCWLPPGDYRLVATVKGSPPAERR